MATYYPSSNNPRDAAAVMHYLRETLPTSYSEVGVLPSNMNHQYMSSCYSSSSSGSYSDALAGNSQQQQIPSDSTPVLVQPPPPPLPQQEMMPNLGGSHDLGAWSGGPATASLLHAGQNLQAQGLSLSLGTQIPSIQYRNPNQGFTSFLSPYPSVSGEGGSSSRDENSRSAEFLRPSTSVLAANQDTMKADPSSTYGMSTTTARTIPRSKYLKAAQQLLDEVVNVRKALKQLPESENELSIKAPKEADGGSKNGSGTPPASYNPQEPLTNSSTELSPAERQDLQNKMTKLLAMLDEVDRRYKQYYHQMQIVVSSFDAIAGSGAAKPYTALALQTISRHFRCLRDAIAGQIRSTRRSLGEQDASGNSKGVGISRLRYVDQQLRQQRALQQLGMMQQHAWRPQRGLPESSVSILRAWLFEHFLHPYPKDSDKIMLARQTGLTRSQVSNWFINARVRLWKPMVEEMYKEEIGDADVDSNSSSENAPKATKGDVEERGDDFGQSTTSTATERFLVSKSSSSAPDVDMGGGGATFRNDETQTEYGMLKLTGEPRPPSVEDCSSSDRFMAAAAAYHHMSSEFGRFRSGTGSVVSLTLGLQNCEGGGGGGGGLPFSGGGHHSFMGMRVGNVYSPAAPSVATGTDAADFDCMDPGNQQHRFNSSHLLHDFVA